MSGVGEGLSILKKYNQKKVTRGREQGTARTIKAILGTVRQMQFASAVRKPRRNFRACAALSRQFSPYSIH